MSPSKSPMIDDTIMTMYRQGLSFGDIAARTGRTRNAIAGHVYRYKKRGGPHVPKTRSITLDEAKAALEASGGNIRAASRSLGVSYTTFYRYGLKGKPPKGSNLAKDPATHALLVEMADSGISDAHFMAELDLSSRTIWRWRTGRSKARAFLAQCVRDVIKKNSPGY